MTWTFLLSPSVAYVREPSSSGTRTSPFPQRALMDSDSDSSSRILVVHSSLDQARHVVQRMSIALFAFVSDL